MKVASLHHDYMCLVTAHRRNFTVWWCKWMPCGSSRGVEILSLGKVSRGESHPGWTLPVRGFSNKLLQLSSGEKFWRKRLAQLWQLNASSDCVTEFTWWKKAVMLKSVTLHWLHRNNSIWEAKGCVPATVSLTFTCRNQKTANNRVHDHFLPIKFLPQVLFLILNAAYLVFICNLFLLGYQQFLSFTCWKLLHKLIW